MENLNELLNSIGEPGSRKRLEAIAALNLGERSEAAKRVLIKRENELKNKNNPLNLRK